MNADLHAALDDISRTRERLAALVAPLSREQFEAARPGGWTPRRVLQHVIDSEAVYAKLLAHQCGRTAPEAPAGDTADGAQAVAALAVTRAAVLGLVDGIDDATLYRLVAFGHDEYSPLSVLQNIASHDRDHHGQIEEMLAPPPPVRPAARVASVSVRAAVDADVPRLTVIYNHYVVNSPATFDIEPFTPEQRREWFGHYRTSGPHRLLVAEADGVVAGYACTSQFRTKPAYDTTVEVTVYCAPEATGRGIGAALYAALFEAIRGEDLRMAIAGITMPNAASIALHERFGFTRAGLMHGIGRKFGRYWDVAWYEKALDRR